VRRCHEPHTPTRPSRPRSLIPAMPRRWSSRSA
jgi:hypothetical protein